MQASTTPRRCASLWPPGCSPSTKTKATSSSSGTGRRRPPSVWFSAVQRASATSRRWTMPRRCCTCNAMGSRVTTARHRRAARSQSTAPSFSVSCKSHDPRRHLTCSLDPSIKETVQMVVEAGSGSFSVYAFSCCFLDLMHENVGDVSTLGHGQQLSTQTQPKWPHAAQNRRRRVRGRRASRLLGRDAHLSGRGRRPWLCAALPSNRRSHRYTPQRVVRVGYGVCRRDSPRCAVASVARYHCPGAAHVPERSAVDGCGRVCPGNGSELCGILD